MNDQKINLIIALCTANVLLFLSSTVLQFFLNHKSKLHMSKIAEQIQSALDDINTTTNGIAETTNSVAATILELRDKVLTGGMTETEEQNFANVLSAQADTLNKVGEALKQVGNVPAPGQPAEQPAEQPTEPAQPTETAADNADGGQDGDDGE